MIPDMTALPYGSVLTHLGTLMPSGGGHIIGAVLRRDYLLHLDLHEAPAT